MEDRINDGLLRRILADADSCPACNTMPQCQSGCSNEADGRRCADSCECHDGWGLSGYPLAMVYSVLQGFEDIYDLDCALSAGTIFKKLDLPFKGMTVTRGGGCRG